MIPSRIWTEIEDPLFGASLGVVSTPRAFDDGLMRQPVFRDLLGALTNREDAQLVADRVFRLISERSDQRYCHPRDLPIGVYLRALDIAAPDHALWPARLALDLPNLWWGNVMARRIATAPNRTVTSSRAVSPISVDGIVWTANTKTTTVPLPTAEVKVRPEVLGKLTTSTNSGQISGTVQGGRFHVRSATTAT